MPKTQEQDLLDDDGPPPDDSILNAKGVNRHGCKPCPFCGATDVHSGPVQIISVGDPDHAVKCGHCDCVGLWAITAKLAIELWNFGFQASRPASGRRTRNESRPKNRKQKVEP